MPPWKRCICVSFSDWHKEQSRHEIFLNLNSFSFKYNTFRIFYWKICRSVSTVTWCGKRYTCFQSMSLIWKRSSKHNCDLAFELFRDICREFSSLLLHLSKDLWHLIFFNQVVIIHWKSIRNMVTSKKFFFPRFWNCIYQLNSKILLLVTQLNCISKSNQAFAIPFSLKSCPTWLIHWFARLLLHEDLLSILKCLLKLLQMGYWETATGCCSIFLKISW